MKIIYDKKVDAMYLSLKKGKYSHTKKITDSIMVDLSDSNEVLGLEILDASRNVGKINPVKIEIDSLTSHPITP